MKGVLQRPRKPCCHSASLMAHIKRVTEQTIQYPTQPIRGTSRNSHHYMNRIGFSFRVCHSSSTQSMNQRTRPHHVSSSPSFKGTVPRVFLLYIPDQNSIRAYYGCMSEPHSLTNLGVRRQLATSSYWNALVIDHLVAGRGEGTLFI